MERDLKPCPMCGNPAELKATHYLESEQPYSYVHCTNEQCELHHHSTRHFSSPDEEKNSADAVSAWNQMSERSAGGSENAGHSAAA